MNTPKKQDIHCTDKSELTHFNAAGQAHIVDIGEKQETHRLAVAEGSINMQPGTLALIESGNAKKEMYLASPALPR